MVGGRGNGPQFLAARRPGTGPTALMESGPGRSQLAACGPFSLKEDGVNGGYGFVQATLAPVPKSPVYLGRQFYESVLVSGHQVRRGDKDPVGLARLQFQDSPSIASPGPLAGQQGRGVVESRDESFP